MYMNNDLLISESDGEFCPLYTNQLKEFYYESKIYKLTSDIFCSSKKSEMRTAQWHILQEYTARFMKICIWISGIVVF